MTEAERKKLLKNAEYLVSEHSITDIRLLASHTAMHALYNRIAVNEYECLDIASEALVNVTTGKSKKGWWPF